MEWMEEGMSVLGHDRGHHWGRPCQEQNKIRELGKCMDISISIS